MLVSALRYEDLEVQDGMEAQAVWNLMLKTKNKTAKNEWIRRLKAYCEMDTRATLDIYRVLNEFRTYARRSFVA